MAKGRTLMSRKSVIFDLDGTLWDVTDSTYFSANQIANKYGLEKISKETICKVFGLNREESAKLYFPMIELNESVKLIDEIAVININNLKQTGGKLYPDIKNTLDKLYNEYDLYIVSNTAEIEYIKAFLISSNLKDYFKDYVAASSLKISKAEAIRKVIKENEIEKVVYIGDTIKDLEATQIAKVDFIQAKYGFGDDLNTKYYINEFKELPQVLEKIL